MHVDGKGTWNIDRLNFGLVRYFPTAGYLFIDKRHTVSILSVVCIAKKKYVINLIVMAMGVWSELADHT